MPYPSLPRSTRKDTRVLIIEDHALFAESLELALTIEGYDVRRLDDVTTSSVQALVTRARRKSARIVLVDLDLGEHRDGLALVAPLAELGMDVVVVTADEDRARWGDCLRHGARRVVSKSEPLDRILATVRRLHEGMPVLPPSERAVLLAAWQQQREQHLLSVSLLESLTRREQEILSRLMGGLTVREIARDDVVSEATVRTQVKSILGKLGVSSQLAAVGLAHQVGWHGSRTGRGTHA